MKKGRGGKKVVNRKIEEILHKPKETAPNPGSTMKDQEITTVAPPAKALKGRDRSAKIAPSPSAQATVVDHKTVQEQPVLPKSKVGRSQAVVSNRSPAPPSKETTPIESPQSSDAENHPPSSKLSVSAKRPATPHSSSGRIPLTTSTPTTSPSKRNVIAGLQSVHPWKAADLDEIFLKSPGDENTGGLLGKEMLGEAMQKATNGDLTSPEQKMTVEEWIHYNAEMAEEKLRNECERMVGCFEREGMRAMKALEGVECVE
jgi:hypothetical protein